MHVPAVSRRVGMLAPESGMLQDGSLLLGQWPGAAVYAAAAVGGALDLLQLVRIVSLLPLARTPLELGVGIHLLARVFGAKTRLGASQRDPNRHLLLSLFVLLVLQLHLLHQLLLRGARPCCERRRR